MNIAGFFADVRTAIGRGSANDAVLPGWAQEAINLLENEHTFQWMRRTVELPIAVGENSNRIALPNDRVKAIDWVKYGKHEGAGAHRQTFYSDPLTSVDPFDVVSVDSGAGTGYYLDGVNTIVTDGRVQQADTLFVHYFEFTEWPEDENVTPTVLARHYQPFKAHFMLTAAGNLRDERLATIWSGLAQRGVAAMVAADTELMWHSRRGLRVGGRSE